jgi:CBS domain-containing membrane protein
MTVIQLMTRHPICVSPEERLDIALALMTTGHFRHLPVLHDGRLVGILALGDIYAVDLSSLRATPAQRALYRRGIEVGRVMRAPVEVAAPDDPMWSAARRLVERSFSCLPVVDGERLVGIVTRTDFLLPAIAQLTVQDAVCGTVTPVSRLMTPCPLSSVDPTDSLDVASVLMKVEHVHQLPVLDGERLVGFLTEHDVLAADETSLAPPYERLLERHAISVSQVMSRSVVTVDADEPVADAARLLRRKRLVAVPVLRDGRIQGILGVTDFFYYLLSFAPPLDEGALASRPEAD